MKDNDTCTMAVFRADAGKWLECSGIRHFGHYDCLPKHVEDDWKIYMEVIIMDTVNKGKVSIDELVDIRDVVIDPTLDKEKRMQSFAKQIKNPQCYRYGEYIVKISFAEDSERTIDGCFEDYLRSL